MLLAGFIIAIGLVITTVLLNNIIFQGSMAGEAAGDSSKYEIVNMMQIAGDEMKSAYRNANGTSNSLQIANFSRQMQYFNGNLSKIYALHGGGINVSSDVSNWNNYRYANYTKNGTANGAVNWTVIENVQDVSVFNFTNVNTMGSNFTVYITNQSGGFLWSMQLTGSNNELITVTNKSSKPDNMNYVSINVLTVGNGNPWKFKTSVVAGTIYNIVFLNGSDAYGGYNIIGYTSSGRNFTRARDYVLNATVTFSTSRVRANITIPVSVPW